MRSRTSSFTPTDCGALAFEPHIAASVGQRGMTARRAKPAVSTAITQGPEQTGQSSATVTLPPTFSGPPDVPLASFRLDLAGGSSGAFLLGSDLCAGRPAAIGAAFAAHSARSSRRAGR